MKWTVWGGCPVRFSTLVGWSAKTGWKFDVRRDRNKRLTWTVTTGGGIRPCARWAKYPTRIRSWCRTNGSRFGPTVTTTNSATKSAKVRSGKSSKPSIPRATQWSPSSLYSKYGQGSLLMSIWNGTNFFYFIIQCVPTCFFVFLQISLFNWPCEYFLARRVENLATRSRNPTKITPSKYCENARVFRKRKRGKTLLLFVSQLCFINFFFFWKIALVMEYVPRSLKEIIETEGILSEERTRSIICHLVSALNYLHRKSILHR